MCVPTVMLSNEISDDVFGVYAWVQSAMPSPFVKETPSKQAQTRFSLTIHQWCIDPFDSTRREHSNHITFASSGQYAAPPRPLASPPNLYLLALLSRRCTTTARPTSTPTYWSSLGRRETERSMGSSQAHTLTTPSPAPTSPQPCFRFQLSSPVRSVLLP